MNNKLQMDLERLKEQKNELVRRGEKLRPPLYLLLAIVFGFLTLAIGSLWALLFGLAAVVALGVAGYGFVQKRDISQRLSTLDIQIEAVRDQIANS